MARWGIFGRSGSGKSWYFGALLEDLVPKFDYAVHVDIEDEEQGLSQKGSALYKTFYVDEEFFNQRVEYEEREMPLIDAVILENKKVRVVPDGLTPTEYRELFAQISELAMEIGKTDANILVSADEAHHLVPSEGNLDGELDERVIRMLTGGRKKGVEWALCTQRPRNVHDEAFTQMSMGVYFSLAKDSDVAKVNGSSTMNAYDYLYDLEPREFILDDLDSGEIWLHTTDDLDRSNPHFAADDGVADDVLRASAEGGEEIDPRQD